MIKVNFLLAAASILFFACNGGDTNTTSQQVDQVNEDKVIRENKYPDALYSFKKDGLYGYINYLGEVVIEPKFKFALSFGEDGLARINEYNQMGNQFGFINKKGEVVITPQFSNASGFDEGLAVVGLSRQTGYINTEGDIVLDYQYSTAGFFEDGIAKVCHVVKIDNINTKVFGYIDRTGKEIIPIKHKTLGEYRDGLILHRKESGNGNRNTWGYFTKEGKDAFNKTYYGAGEFYGGYAYTRIKKGNKWVSGFINTKGEVAFELPDTLESAGETLTKFAEGHAIIRNDKYKYGVIDSTGKVTSAFIYDEYSSFSEGLALVNLDGKKGYIDHNGNMIIEAQYEAGFPFKDGYARVVKDDKYGFIDKSGNYVHEPAFRNAYDFHNGLALVKQADGTTAYIDEDGRVVLAPAGDAEHFHIGMMQ